jgi:3-phosphoshikimate 1-carboxyvinyltransferase
MKRWRVRPSQKPLRGAIHAPGDAHIATIAVLLGSLTRGTTTVHGVPDVARMRSLRRALDALGVIIRVDGDAWRVEGAGSYRAPSGPIETGHDAELARALAGVLAGAHLEVPIEGSASASMASVTRALRSRGAKIDGAFDAKGNDERLPIQVRSLPAGARLASFDGVLPAMPGVKTALLLSGLGADGPTALTETIVSRDHTERMLDAMGAPIRTLGSAVYLDPTGWDRALTPLEIRVPGDVSSAMYSIVAAHLVAGSRLIVRDTGVNPTRTGALDVLRDMGGGVIAQPRESAGDEPVADLHVGAFEPAVIRAPARVGGELALRSGDEIAALVAASVASPKGTSEFRDAPLESLASAKGLAAMLSAFDVHAELLADGLRVQSARRPRGGARIASGGDASIARAAAVIALVADGETTVDDVACIDDVDPGFVSTLRRIGADIEEEA